MMTAETYLEDLAYYLQDQGFGIAGLATESTDASIEVSGYYDAATNSIFLTPYGGSEKNDIVSGEEDLTVSDIQILVRNIDPEKAYKDSVKIYKLLRKKFDWDVGTTHFFSLRAKAPPIFIRKTNSGYMEYSTNFTTKVS